MCAQRLLLPGEIVRGRTVDPHGVMMTGTEKRLINV
ncbi:hypothetical protein SFR_0621 [Streptomyces sp. FR-008]|nr:hypothetical protein SFR_0621 [Streptomyces sp. FR-008]